MEKIAKHIIATDEVDWEWSQDALATYVHDNYHTVAPEDRFLGAAAISALAAHVRQHDLFHTLPFGAHISAGSVPRGSAMMAPLITPVEQGGYIDVSDLKRTNVDATRVTLECLARGDLGIWEAHQDEYTAVNPAWDNAFQLAGQLAEGHVHQQDMRNLAPHTYPFIAVEYGPESATTIEEEYQGFIKTICDALLPDGILYMAYLIESEGYTVGGVAKPSFPVTVDYVSKLLEKNGMQTLANAGTAASYAAREAGDAHRYGGMGAVIAVKAS